MWTPDELGGAECLSSLADGASLELCRSELLNPTIDMTGDGVFDSGRMVEGDTVFLATDRTGDGFADTVTRIGPDGTYEVWQVSESAASGTAQWRLDDGGLLA
ncbi:DUF6802 family protein [Hoyosella altamirensis]|uniref:DUF6802 domain-containing protein n=1 Tax=Hoyosella altamirensis TaxID=616997 RepID=A0A839RU09_9ACTN|nr:DUF6802 family protein [Hoyosella altamirensis]MBB3039554.1 hypothetical protein [Hoyosella altamirensis]